MNNEHLFAGAPVLIDRADALAILDTDGRGLARYQREGRLEHMGADLFRTAQIREILALRRTSNRRNLRKAEKANQINADIASENSHQSAEIARG